ncbi:DUF4232 domain-containing protein, partial [Streptomyces sp. G-G2]|uniref:DUF4232 domain-containing protein n=1 Tax=Streptomyces sp. G-G2 TaxID=3046201 RepID=UPI0032D8DC2F
VLVGCDTPPAPPVAPGPTGRPVRGLPYPSDAGLSETPGTTPGTAPGASGDPCPESGVRLSEDPGDAAMGLRAGGLTLVNCGTRPYPLDGYPEIQVLGKDVRPVRVSVVHGADGITTGVPTVDAPPRPLVLRPGDSARVPLLWRNLVTEVDVPAVEGWYVDVTARPGAAPVRLRLTQSLDLGNTGKLAIGPWQVAQAAPGAPGAP